jgi:curved DNA-binding protein CbpA
LPEFDAYAVLGVSERADPHEIERAWRRALRATHPDRNPDVAVARVRDVVRAGQILRDPARRARYDRARRAARLRQRRPTWSTLAWDAGVPQREEVRLPGGLTVIFR